MIVHEIGHAPGAWLATALARADVGDIPGLTIDAAGVVSVDDAAPGMVDGAPGDALAARLVLLVAALEAHDHDADDAAAPAPTLGASPAVRVLEARKPIGLTFFAEAAAATVSLEGVGVDLGAGVLTLADDVPSDRAAALAALLAAHDPTSPANARVAELEAIDADCLRRLAVGYLDAGTRKRFAVLGAARVDFTTVATACLAELVAPTGARFDLIPIDNATVKGLAAADALGILRRAFGWTSATILHARDLKNAVLAGGHPDVNAGWPSQGDVP